MSQRHRGFLVRRRCLLILCATGLVGCDAGQAAVDTSVCKDGIARPVGWTYASHCPHAAAGYDEVFDASKVRRLDFTIDRTVFAESQADLETIVANAGTDDLDAIPDPMWMQATLTYDTNKWSHVAVRWKGHASLVGAYGNHIGKLSMRVKFDHFGERAVSDQRFFGFEGFTLTDGYKDDSLIRDKTAADILRAAGIPAPRGSYARVYIDIGDGPFYLGLYTLVEKVEDQMLATQLGTHSGNLYKPWGDAARWPPIADPAFPLSTTSVADIKTHFEKQTNESSGYDDILNAIHVLHSDRASAAVWRANLEAVFNVPSFLKWLAVNQVMYNWDSYGCMPHNYYVYANPADNGRFLWLPWDLNEALAARKHDGCVPGSVMLDEIVQGGPGIGKEWPLIKFILGDATYRTTYEGYVRAVLDGPFAADQVKARMRADHALIAPYVDGTVTSENGALKDALFTGWFSYQNTTAANFATSLTRVGNGQTTSDGLEVHVDNRRATAQAALDNAH